MALVSIDEVVALFKVALCHYSSMALIFAVLVYSGHPFLSAWPLTFLTLTLVLLGWQRMANSRARVSWDDETVLITGGASGIGRLLSQTLALNGATVVVVDIQSPDDLHRGIIFYQCDLCSPPDIATTYSRIVEEVGPITVLVNNAATLRPGPVRHETQADAQHTFQVNVLAPIQLTQLALGSMLEASHGHIVNVSSALGYSGACQVGSYAASKAALVTYSDSLRQELKHLYQAADDVHLTVVAPGFLNTALFDGAHIPYPFWFPTVEPLDIVLAITAAIEQRQSRDIRLPLYAKGMPLMPVLPLWLKDLCHSIGGANQAMATHHKCYQA
ncbi:hypothetical protein H4R35_003983 [Dimargaris xerosporica]|nr:hypothetical protein H4R35_003983 [Dimargaris xerosporica]